MLDNIPFELRQLNQWLNADMTLNEKGEPKKTPLNPRTGAYASVDDPNTWGSFSEAIATGKPIGFVLSKNDPYCIIDLDDKLSNPASDEEKQRFSDIISTFETYTELSTSGRGAHLIVKGVLPKGTNRSHVEMYSEGRYMICTGNVIKNYPIAERQELLDLMYAEMQPTKITEQLMQVDSIYTDAQILERATSASNSDKYNNLWLGNWKDLYPSQSEADFALMSMFCFYTKDNQQAIRLFRQSALGKRDKAQRDDYFIGKYGIINKIRANELPDLDFTELKVNAQKAMANSARRFDMPKEVECKSVEVPNGLIGELTDYFMSTATRPVKEVALAAALTLVAGVAGRVYNTSTGTGLNLYIILLAKTGSGKEGAQNGIERLLCAVKSAGAPTVEDFIGPAAFASGQALIKVLGSKPCFFSILGEFGLTLQELSDPRSNSSVKMLKKVLLDLYSKSGASDVLRSSVYSDTEKNTAIVQSPSVTILGESTPETFFEALNESQIAEGLIPRFSIIQYMGMRPSSNPNAGHAPSEQLIAKFMTLIAGVLTAANSNVRITVTMNKEAQALLDEFDKKADTLIIQHSEGTPELQLWNRAHLKALKLASLLAVSQHPIHPEVDAKGAQWAIDFVIKDITLITSQFSEGSIGKGEAKQVSDLKAIIISYFKSSPTVLRTHGEELLVLQKNGLIPYKFIQRRSNLASFRNDKFGHNVSLKRALQILVDSGMLRIVPNAQFQDLVRFEGICYTVTGDW